ncbi:hypothetical protein LF41_926 [Lysobacter dokdonensis DS-58]|uniref:Uncharacterized protein n=1 Tax=Lysobacter dokdonensis DS-58 TaxID=1300345 RepID=A0A0A2X539_9GAMM|nr:hypothetical protein LF41_926 [Lysobacter dokdonensis DS-58]
MGALATTRKILFDAGPPVAGPRKKDQPSGLVRRSEVSCG